MRGDNNSSSRSEAVAGTVTYTPAWFSSSVASIESTTLFSLSNPAAYRSGLHGLWVSFPTGGKTSGYCVKVVVVETNLYQLQKARYTSVRACPFAFLVD